MAPFAVPHLRLEAVAAAVPAHEARNDDLPLLGETRDAFIHATGVRARRVAPAGLCASDLSVAAAHRLLEATGLAPAEIGALVVVTQTPDFPLPGNGGLVQRRLGLRPSTLILDLNQGCAGYVYGLATLASLMATAGIDRGLLLAGDTLTRLLSPGDRSTVPIFSDAGSATLLARYSGAAPMVFHLGTDGCGAEALLVPCGGARRPFTADGLVGAEIDPHVVRAPVHLAMRGVDVLQYVLRHVAPGIRELLAFAGAGMETPDFYVFHQANRVLNASLARQLGLDPSRTPETLTEFGNTSSATIPLTICHRLGARLAARRARLLLSGFGSGFSWGSALVDAEAVRCLEISELNGSDGGSA